MLNKSKKERSQGKEVEDQWEYGMRGSPLYPEMSWSQEVKVVPRGLAFLICTWIPGGSASERALGRELTERLPVRWLVLLESSLAAQNTCTILSLHSAWHVVSYKLNEWTAWNLLDCTLKGLVHSSSIHIFIALKIIPGHGRESMNVLECSVNEMGHGCGCD